jgi:hypothetical protein
MSKKNKKIILSLVAFSVIVFPVFVFAQFGFPDTQPEPGIPGGTPDQTGGYAGVPTTIQDVIYSAMQWALSILAAISIVGFVIAGILYLLSGGDDARMKTAKSAMVASIIGVIVGIVGLVIMYAAANFLSASTF